MKLRRWYSRRTSSRSTSLATTSFSRTTNHILISSSPTSPFHGSSYYGPFLPAVLARNTLNLINRAFQLRTCEIEIDGKLPRPCLEYHLKRCLGPCVKGLCTQTEYQEAAADVRILLEGRNKELAKDLEERMWHYAEQDKYELAAKY